MTKAGDNEKEFRDRMGKNQNDIDNLLGKLRLCDTDKANISVDGHFAYNGKLYLVEIDSANEAKLLAGQYILLDVLFNTAKLMNYSKANCVFLVIHYFNDYNPERTEKVLKTLKNKLKTTINFMAFHQKDISDWSELLSKIDSKSK
ncbi:MAG: hypothetical protein K2M47_05425 [Clostridiales bacterium]|nr:hypothetical protein [Clostridiales bacterium]